MPDPSFSHTLLDRHAAIWEKMVSHPFLIAARDGTLDDQTFHTWLRQDYLFVEAAIPFIGHLIARAPSPELRAALAPIPQALEAELDLFRERAQALEVSVDNIEPGFTNHAYIQFLKAVGSSAPFEAALTVYWAAEKAYHESWKVVRPGIDSDHRWYPFVDNWAGDEFGELVQFLGAQVEEFAASSTDATRQIMEHHFEMTTRYEVAFWEMAHRGPQWPGI